MARIAHATAPATAAGTPAAGQPAEAEPNPAAPGNKLTKVGVVLDRGAAGAFDDAAVESLFPFFDPESGRIGGVYTGYKNNAGTLYGSIGLAYSDDGVTWTKAGQLIGGSGTAGAPDRYGATAPVIVYDGGLYHLFRLGLDQPGYEQGTKQIVLSTTPSLRAPQWTHRGVVMSPGGSGWRSGALWHPNFVRSGNTWYCFINASGADAKERIGYATAPSLLGPWTFDDANSPLMASAVAGDSICGDPFVRKTPGGWRMDYFTAGATAVDWYTTTTDAAFPLGWRAHDGADLTRRTVNVGAAGSYDELFAHKPCLLVKEGRVYHYYTAVMAGNANRRVALAVDPPLPPAPARAARAQSNPAATSINLPANGAYANPDDPAQLVVAAQPGDWLLIGLSAVADNQAGDLRVDVGTYVGGALKSYVSGLGAADHGIAALGAIGGRWEAVAGSVAYQVKPADVDHATGTVTLKLLVKAQSAARSILRSGDPIIFWATNQS